MQALLIFYLESLKKLNIFLQIKTDGFVHELAKHIKNNGSWEDSVHITACNHLNGILLIETV